VIVTVISSGSDELCLIGTIIKITCKCGSLWLPALYVPLQIRLTYIFMNFACHPALLRPPIVELAWYHHLRASLGTNDLAIGEKTCFLATRLQDGFKCKELLYNEWKSGTCSFSHWQTTKLLIASYISALSKTGFCSSFTYVPTQWAQFTLHNTYTNS